MKLYFKQLIKGSLIITASLLNLKINAQDAAALFKPCSVCHSIGKGRMVGPDLSGITAKRSEDWLIKFIQSSKSVIASGDADAVAIAKEFNNTPMPDNVLTAQQIKSILVFIDGGIGNTKGSSAKETELSVLQKSLDSLIKANSTTSILIGNELFNGYRRFENGGLSCASCHNASQNGYGGLYAKDLTNAFSRLGGLAGIKGIIGIPPFPAMTLAYKDHPITEEENAYIQLYLQKTNKLNPQGPIVQKAVLFYGGFAIGIFIVGLIILFWFKHKRRSVNHLIMKRQERYSK